MPDATAFSQFVTERSPALLRAGWLLTGDWAAAEDLVQDALVRCWPRWSSIEAPDAYVRRAMVRQYVSRARRRSSSELPMSDLHDVANVDVGEDRADAAMVLRAALDALPRRQRVAVVLRYFLDLSEADTADAMHVSVGTVKSTTHRALETLRTSPRLARTAEGW